MLVAAGAALCLLVGCQGSAAPDGVRLYEPQTLDLDRCIVSVETTSVSGDDAAIALGLRVAPTPAEQPPEGYERLTLVARLENTSQEEFLTTASPDSIRILQMSGDALPVVMNAGFVRGVSDEPSPLEGSSNLAPGGTVTAIVSVFVPQGEQQVMFDWMIDAASFATIGLSPAR